TSDRPAGARRVGFVPPTVQYAAIDAAVEDHFHAAGAASFEEAARRVHPKIHARSEPARDVHIVAFDEDKLAFYLRQSGELYELPNQFFRRRIFRVSFAGNDDLHGTLFIVENGSKPFGILQKEQSPLVSCHASSKADSEHVMAEYLRCFLQFRRQSAAGFHLVAHALTAEIHQPLAPALSDPPHLFVRHIFESLPHRLIGGVIHPTRAEIT